jgi:outer membrane lipoprotein carrier protein
VATATPSASASASPSAVASASPAPAEVAGADGPTLIARRLDAIFADRKHFRARFEQRYTVAAQGVEKRSTGVVLVERPGKLSFRYDAPNGNRIVADGQELKVVYVAEDQQMIVQPLSKTQMPAVFGLLMGSGISSSFAFRQGAKPEPGEVRLLGKPITPSPSYDLVQFSIDEASFPESIAAAEFAFTPPAGTSIKRP